MENIYYFFRGNPDINNFIVFGRIHLFILFIALLGIFIMFRNKSENRKLELFMGYILVLQQVSLYVWYFTSNYNLLKEGLPFYHCRVAIIFIALGLILNKEKIMKIGSYLGIFGSILALLFPVLDPFSFPHITQFSFFIGHLFLLWGSVYLLFIKSVGMTELDFKRSLTFINVYHFSMLILNKILKSNYAYMAASPISIGRGLNHSIYALIVIMLFNILISIEYTVVKFNNKVKSQNQISLATLD